MGGDGRERRRQLGSLLLCRRRGGGESEGHRFLLSPSLRGGGFRVGPGVELFDEGVGSGPGRGADGAREGGEGAGRRRIRRRRGGAGGEGEESRGEGRGAFVAAVAPFLSLSRRLSFLLVAFLLQLREGSRRRRREVPRGAEELGHRASVRKAEAKARGGESGSRRLRRRKMKKSVFFFSAHFFFPR